MTVETEPKTGIDKALEEIRAEMKAEGEFIRKLADSDVFKTPTEALRIRENTESEGIE